MTVGSHDLKMNVAELLRRPASRKSVHAVMVASGLAVVDSAVPDGAEIDIVVDLESLSDGIVVTGTVSAPFVSHCRRCLIEVEGRLDVDVRELYQSRPVDDEAFALAGEVLDLEPLAREAVLLELPLAPLCRPDCAGLCATCGANRNDTDCGHVDAPVDLRWAALDELSDRLDLSDN